MFGNGSYVKIWKLEDKGKYYQAQMSTSRKVEDKYETDWSDNFTRLVGNAASQVRSGKIKEGDRVQIDNCGVTNQYNKEKRVTYTNYVIFSFAENDQNTSSRNTSNKTTQKKDTSFNDVPDGIEEDLPFN